MEKREVNEYIIQGYRIYHVKDLSYLISNISLLSRRKRLEIRIHNNIVLVKSTDKYDKPRNPYV